MPELSSLSAAGIVAAAEGHGITDLVLALLILFAAAKAGAELFERLRQPAVVGEILGGVIVGPQVLNLVQPTEITAAMAEFGVVFLLFLVGLETDPSELLKVGKDALVVAMGGVVLPLLLGYGAMRLWGQPNDTALFVGAALVATSVGITARVLARLGVLESIPSRIILGAAVIDDILGLLVLAIVTSVAGGGAINYRQIGLTVVYAVAFTGFMLCCAGRMVNRARPTLERLRIGHSLYISGIGVCLTLYVLAGYLGVAGIIGAFLAGVAFSEAGEETGLRSRFEDLSEFFVPFFLAGIGMSLNLQSLARPSVLVMAGVVTLLAVVGKTVGCGLPLWRRDRRTAMQVGVGMVPRGEVGIIVAQLGLGVGALKDDLFAVVLFMAVVTTMLAPPLLARLFAGQAKPPPVGQVAIGGDLAG